LFLVPLFSLADSLDDVLEPSAAPPTNGPAACVASVDEVSLMNKKGHAGIMYNVAEHPKSIRVVAANMLAEALDVSATKKTAACAVGCSQSSRSEIIYRVTPIAFIAEPQQQALCLTLERETSSTPLRFPAREFKSVEALNGWVMEFSQGRGEDGKALYAQCGGNCSPRYTFLISPATDGLHVEAEVICGHARDRDVDEYDVSTALRLHCEAPSSAAQP
jgi:hypothetical protein